jgi:hypothetical protein
MSLVGDRVSAKTVRANQTKEVCHCMSEKRDTKEHVSNKTSFQFTNNVKAEKKLTINFCVKKLFEALFAWCTKSVSITSVHCH